MPMFSDGARLRRVATEPTTMTAKARRVGTVRTLLGGACVVLTVTAVALPAAPTFTTVTEPADPTVTRLPDINNVGAVVDAQGTHTGSAGPRGAATS